MTWKYYPTEDIMDEKLPGLYSDVVIIGAGLSGINMACQLQRQLGITNYTIYDRSAELGGAWAANQYPGCGVDIPGSLYSLSWFPNPNFTKLFPPQSEILDYVRRVAYEHDIPEHIVFGTEWTGARWDESSSTWQISLRSLVTGRAYVHTAKVLISAVGGYTNPKYPSLPGLESFEGPVVHTARWDKDYDLDGLDVAIIGNGCSASQVVPAIVGKVKSLTQFIRKPQHYVPMPLSNPTIPDILRDIFEYFPILLMLIRWLVFLFLETAILQFRNDKKGRRMRDQSTSVSQRYVKKNAPEKYWPLLLPNYSLGCRRRILDCNYIKSLNSPNLHLTQDAIASVGPRSVRTVSGQQYDVDFLILATGFEMSQWLGDTVIGRDGQSLAQHWQYAGGIEAYKTVAMNGFPNFFYLLGPNAGSGHTSVLFAMECGVDLVIKLARPLLLREAKSVEVFRHAEVGWYQSTQAALRKTVLADSCSNHYTDPHSGWNSFSYPFSSLSFWFSTRFPDMSAWVYE